MTRTNHVLLTRFNLPSPGVESLLRAGEGWLRNRVALFERYTVPSVQLQNRPGLRWIVYLDPESPPWLLDRVDPWAKQGLLRPILRESVSREELLSDIEETVGGRHGLLVTTNLDNDDGLAADFAERVAEVNLVGPRAVLYLSRGLVRSQEGLYIRTDRRNAFATVLETWDAPITCWAEYHNRLPSLMPAIELKGAPAWLQVVHGENVSNRVRGRLTSPAIFRDRFGDMLDDLPEPRASERSADLLVRHPARLVRDSLRSAARSAGLAVLGKDGFSRAKYLVASRARSH